MPLLLLPRRLSARPLSAVSLGAARWHEPESETSQLPISHPRAFETLAASLPADLEPVVSFSLAVASLPC